MKNSKNSNEKQNFNSKDFLTALQKLNSIESYQNLGFILNSICKITKTALLAEQEYKNETICHDSLDLFNLISLLQNLLPNDELELLDLLNKG